MHQAAEMADGTVPGAADCCWAMAAAEIKNAEETMTPHPTWLNVTG